MSGEPKDSGSDAPAADPTETGVIPIEVVPPDAPIGEVAEEPADRTAELTAKLAAAEKEKKENWDRYLRAVADLENSRKRQRRELEDAKVDARGKVLKEMLPVVDNLERAIEHAAPPAPGADDAAKAASQAIIEGIQLVLRQFTTAFERLEVTGVEALGQPFDPNLHEAISQLESDKPPGTIVQVLQRGYRNGDRLLRPALVVVAKAKPE